MAEWFKGIPVVGKMAVVVAAFFGFVGVLGTVFGLVDSESFIAVVTALVGWWTANALVISLVVAVVAVLLLLTTIGFAWEYREARAAAKACGDEGDLAHAVAADEVLFKQFWRELPHSPTIEFLSENNFAGFSYDSRILSPLFRFEGTWTDAAHEFLTPTLEEKKRVLMAAIHEFTSLEVQETFPVQGAASRQSVPAEWEIQQPERFWRVVNGLHERAEAVVIAHQALVREALLRLPDARQTMAAADAGI